MNKIANRGHRRGGILTGLVAGVGALALVLVNPLAASAAPVSGTNTTSGASLTIDATNIVDSVGVAVVTSGTTANITIDGSDFNGVIPAPFPPFYEVGVYVTYGPDEAFDPNYQTSRTLFPNTVWVSDSGVTGSVPFNVAAGSSFAGYNLTISETYYTTDTVPQLIDCTVEDCYVQVFTAHGQGAVGDGNVVKIPVQW